MISTAFFQELFTGNIQENFLSGKGSAKQGGEAQSGFAAILGRVMDDAPNSPDTTPFAEGFPTGHRFLEQLKKAIMASGISLDAKHVDADAMAEFRNLLVKAGFNKQEVQEMITDLTSDDTGKGVTLATLFAKASQLSEPNEDGDESVLLDISALPYIETILGQLGMDEESIRGVLAGAKIEGRGIDIEKLAGNIRRAMVAGKGSTGNVSGDTNDILEMMRRIGLMENDAQSLSTTLDKMISELSDLNKKNEGLSEEVSGSLLISYLQQLTASLGDDGENLRQLIGSAGNDGEGFNGEALLARLVQLRQELSTASAVSGMKRLAGIQGENSTQGEMSLSRFVSALEARISEAHQIRTTLEKETPGRPTARVVGNFLEKISSDVASAQSKSTASAVMEQEYETEVLMRDVRQATEKRTTGINAKGGDPGRNTMGNFTGAGQVDDKEVLTGNARQTAEKSIADVGGKDGQKPNILEAIRQASSGADTGRGTSENSAGKDDTGKFMDSLASAVKQKVKKTTEQNLSAADGFTKAVKSADEVSNAAKMPAGRTLPGYLLDQVSRQIVKLRTAGENEITLQLKPPHLGRMKLNVENTSGGIKVGIVVESAAAKEMLLSHTSELKAALGDQGIRLDKIDVGTQGDFGNSMAQAGREFGRSGGRNGRQSGRGLSGNSIIPEGSDLPEVVRTVDTGRLDLVA